MPKRGRLSSICTNSKFTKHPKANPITFLFPAGRSQNKTIADLDAIAGPKTGPFRLGITSPECNKYAMQFICAEVFHPCRNLPSAAGPVPIPIPTCKRRCERFVEACGQYLRDFNSTVPNCNSINPATNQSTYPEILMQLKLPSGAIVRFLFL